MKRLILRICLATGFLAPGFLAGQPVPVAGRDKPLLFADLPEKTDCSTAVFAQLIALRPGTQVDLPLAAGLHIRGMVVDKVQPAPGVQSVNIRIDNYHRALFTLTARTLPGEALAWSGRIHHFRYGDALTIEPAKGSYVLQKRAQHLLLPD